MPKLSQEAKRDVAPMFARWLTCMMTALKITPGAVSYRSKVRAAAGEGTELSTDTVSRLMFGKAAPMPQTVVALVPLLRSASGSGPSTPYALSWSYPYALVRIMAGLCEIRSTISKPKGPSERDSHHEHWLEFCEKADAILRRIRFVRKFDWNVPPDLTPFVKAIVPLGEFKGWLKRLSLEYPEDFATCLGYAYLAELVAHQHTSFGPYSRSGAVLRSVLDTYDEEFEQLYRRALHNYPLRLYRPRMISNPDLRTAEDLLKNHSLEMGTRKAAANEILGIWATQGSSKQVSDFGLVRWIPKEDYLSPDELAEGGYL